MWNLTEGQWLCLVFGRPKDLGDEPRWVATLLWGFVGFAAVFVSLFAVVRGWLDFVFHFDPPILGAAFVVNLVLDVVAGINFIAALGGPVSNTFVSAACVAPIFLGGISGGTSVLGVFLLLGICLFYMAAGIAAGYGGARLRKLRERRHQRMHSDQVEEEDREI